MSSLFGSWRFNLGLIEVHFGVVGVHIGSILAVRVWSGSILIKRTKSTPSIDSRHISEHICNICALSSSYRHIAYSNMYLGIENFWLIQMDPIVIRYFDDKKKYRIFEWAIFQVWEFLHPQGWKTLLNFFKYWPQIRFKMRKTCI